MQLEIQKTGLSQDTDVGVVGTDMVFRASEWSFRLLTASPILWHGWVSSEFTCLDRRKKSN